ncbi:MAG: class I SAM-dependent methyltransferase family protein [Thermoplasmata archaeon]
MSDGGIVRARTTRGPATPPAERVRRRVAAMAGAEAAARLPLGYHRMGRVLLLRLPNDLRGEFSRIGQAWRQELGVATVLTQTGPVEGELRHPRIEVIAGAETDTEVIEHGIRYRFDAARIMFATGNQAERERAGRLTRPGETVVDLFAGIGYFALPAALRGEASVVFAAEKNPVAYGYLQRNAELNGVADRVHPLLGDNRELAIPRGEADRIFLGYLPSATGWIPRALELGRRSGVWLHVHRIADVRGGVEQSSKEVRTAIVSEGGSILSAPAARVVKPYGPGRNHVVVDVRARPPD